MMLTTSLPKEVIKAQLARIISSRQFCNAPRLSRFLSYLVEQSLAGESDRLKGYTIGLEVFDKPDDFDPQTDTIVRVQARALRQKLDQYYTQDGKDDPIHITIAKGGYEPAFHVSLNGEPPKDVIDTPNDPIVPKARKPSIAVLPFECIGPGTNCDFLSLGLTEGTISNLSRFKDLSVFSRSTTEKAKLERLSIAQIFKLFEPDFVLEGSFRLRDDLIETHIKLIDAASDEVIMVDQIDMQMDAIHVYEMQDEMVARIAARIAVEYGPIGHYARRVNHSGSAIKWETYAWISRYFEYGLQLDQSSRDEIEAGLKHAITLDPNSAEAHAALAMIKIENYRAMTHAQGDPGTLDRALHHALLSVKCDPENAMAHQSLAIAYFHCRKFADFRANVQRALMLNPGHSDMLAMFGVCYATIGAWDESIPLLDRAVALNPLHPSWYHIPKAIFLAVTKTAAEAIVEIEKAPMPGFYTFHQSLLWLHVEAGNMDAAMREKERLLRVAPDVEKLIKRHLDAWCVHERYSQRMFAAFEKVGLHVID